MTTPPVVFLCLADHVFEGEDTMAVGIQREVLCAEGPLRDPEPSDEEDEKC